jgi:ribonuclease HI
VTTIAATDGSSLGNPGPAGWAWVTADGREASAGARHSTNNRMELRAVLELLLATDASDPLVIQTDSAYVVGIFTEWLEGWKSRGMRTSAKKAVENVDLITEIEKTLVGRNVTFEKVPGHAGHLLNEKADLLANTVAHRAKTRLTRR